MDFYVLGRPGDRDTNQLQDSSDDGYLDNIKNGLNEDAIRELHQGLFSNIANAIRGGQPDKIPKHLRPLPTSWGRCRRSS